MIDPLLILQNLKGSHQVIPNPISIFVLGPHGSGKSKLVSSFQPDASLIAPSISTFGYEITVISDSDSSEISFIEFTNASSENKLLYDLLKQNYQKSCIILIVDMRNPEEVFELEKQFIQPILKELSHFFESMKERPTLKYYYKTFTVEGNCENKEQFKETYIPILFVGSFDDLITDNFNESVRPIRECALRYGAGFSVSHSDSLLQIALSLANRKKLDSEICEFESQDDYFIPNGWDSKEKIKQLPVQKFIKRNDTEEISIVENKDFPTWDEFLERLSKTLQELSEKSTPKSDKNNSNIYFSPTDPDFW